jgi:hypothetical protein
MYVSEQTSNAGTKGRQTSAGICISRQVHPATDARNRQEIGHIKHAQCTYAFWQHWQINININCNFVCSLGLKTGIQAEQPQTKQAWNKSRNCCFHFEAQTPNK